MSRRFATPVSASPNLWWTVGGVLAAAALVVALLYAASAAREAPAIGPSAASSTILSGAVRLNASQFDDGQAHFFRYRTASGKEIRFFVIKSPDGELRAALDACEACYREHKGFREERQNIVCNSCDREFARPSIGVARGGCHPIPLERTVESKQLVIAPAALEIGASYF